MSSPAASPRAHRSGRGAHTYKTPSVRTHEENLFRYTQTKMGKPFHVFERSTHTYAIQEIFHKQYTCVHIDIWQKVFIILFTCFNVCVRFYTKLFGTNLRIFLYRSTHTFKSFLFYILPTFFVEFSSYSCQYITNSNKV